MGQVATSVRDGLACSVGLRCDDDNTRLFRQGNSRVEQTHQAVLDDAHDGHGTTRTNQLLDRAAFFA
jgi:hypothetical protein